MNSKEEKAGSIKGQTYSLYGRSSETDLYYLTIKKLADMFSQHCSDKKNLLAQVRKAGSKSYLSGRLSGGHVDKSLASIIKKTLRGSLSDYTTGVRPHLKSLSLRKRFDKILSTKEEQYHLYMLEIELTNRIYRKDFKKSKYKFALIAHCLRDFRPDCRAVSGDVESICKGCTNECFIHIGSHLLKKYNIHPYISVSMDLEKLFRKLKSEHPDIGALGIACVPELAMGMRLCEKSGISPIGIPLDANRCARWMNQCRESSFSLKELESMLKQVS
jgi:hypothetical protein